MIGRPSFTIPFFIPMAFIVGRQGTMSIPTATIIYGSLLGFLAIAAMRKPKDWRDGKPPPELKVAPPVSPHASAMRYLALIHLLLPPGPGWP